MVLLGVVALGSGWLGAQTAVRAGHAVLAALSGDSVSVGGASSSGTATLNSGGQLEVRDGAHITLTGEQAQLALARGGGIRLCGPAKVDLAAGGQGALLISLEYGALQLRYPSLVVDSLLTPDFRVQTVVPPQQLAAVSASLSVATDGTLCVMNRGSALSVERLWDGAQRDVIGGETLAFHPSAGAPTPVPSCPCAAAAPAAVANGATPENGGAAAAGPLFPKAQALTVSAAQAAAGLPSIMANAPPPPMPPAHHNFFVRFLHWLF